MNILPISENYYLSANCYAFSNHNVKNVKHAQEKHLPQMVVEDSLSKSSRKTEVT